MCSVSNFYERTRRNMYTSAGRAEWGEFLARAFLDSTENASGGFHGPIPDEAALV